MKTPKYGIFVLSSDLLEAHWLSHNLAQLLKSSSKCLAKLNPWS